MRLVLLAVAAAVALAGCRAPYMADYANAIVQPDDLPSPGIDRAAVTVWFEERGYAPGPKVLQAEAELLRRPGDPLIYAAPGDRLWWLTAHRTVHHACVTTRTIYYRFDPNGHLARAIYNHRSQC